MEPKKRIAATEKLKSILDLSQQKNATDFTVDSGVLEEVNVLSR